MFLCVADLNEFQRPTTEPCQMNCCIIHSLELLWEFCNYRLGLNQCLLAKP
jgi:hypothetical protein